VEDPVRKGMLFLGTDNFIYVTWDDGAHWTLLRNNMPPAPIYWLTIQKRYNDLVVATYGRGFWILDDITALRDYDLAQQSDAYLFKPRAAYRYRRINATHAIDVNNHVLGQNPPAGADINYFLKTPAKKVELSIAGPNNEPIRKLAGSSEAGINRVWWDLRYDPPAVVKIRNSPPGEPWVTNGSEGWRPLVHWRNETTGPLVAPGTYTVKLNVDGKEFTQKIEILRDPHDVASPQEIQANTQFLLQLRDEMNQSAAIINRIEWTRKQITDLSIMLGDDPKSADVIDAAKKLDQRIQEVESKFFPLSLTGRTEDAFRAPTVLYGKLTNLAFLVEGGSDLPPTDQSVELNKQLQHQLADAKDAVETIYVSAVAQFNSMAKARGISVGLQP
jgi:hypothetical protein